MLTLNVPDMTCGHCASVVTKAVKSVDENAGVAIDMHTQTVTIESPAAAEKVKAALANAGYPTRDA